MRIQIYKNKYIWLNVINAFNFVFDHIIYLIFLWYFVDQIQYPFRRRAHYFTLRLLLMTSGVMEILTYIANQVLTILAKILILTFFFKFSSNCSLSVFPRDLCLRIIKRGVLENILNNFSSIITFFTVVQWRTLKEGFSSIGMELSSGNL